MREFLFWLVRPIAEFLGSLLLLGLLVAVCIVVAAIVDWKERRRSSRRGVGTRA